MRDHEKHLGPVRVLTAFRGELILAFPVADVGRAMSLPASPRIPGTVSWLAGAVCLDGQVLWLVDPLATATVPEVCPVLIAAGPQPRWAMRIDRVGSLMTVTPGGQVINSQWPATWAGSCRLADGRAALFVRPAALDLAAA